MILDIQYEMLVGNADKVLRSLFSKDVLGLEWDPAVLAHHRFNRSINTLSAVQIQSPVYNNSVGRWTKYSEPFKNAVFSELRKYVDYLQTRRIWPEQYSHYLDSLNESV